MAPSSRRSVQRKAGGICRRRVKTGPPAPVCAERAWEGEGGRGGAVGGVSRPGFDGGLDFRILSWREAKVSSHVQVGLSLFAAHNRDGRRLAKPRTVAAAPELFSPPRARGPAPAVSIGGPSPGLDYWREDVLANEHHQHWHEVYPFTGRPPGSFSEWLSEHTNDDFIAILEALDPSQPWRDIVPSATPEELAGLFAQVLSPQVAPALPREHYKRCRFTTPPREQRASARTTSAESPAAATGGPSARR